MMDDPTCGRAIYPNVLIPRRDTMLKIGILGMGMMGGFHARIYGQVPNAQVIAIADVDAGRLQSGEGVEGNIPSNASAPAAGGDELARYPDASALIREAEVDVIDVCLPSYLHARYTIEALEAGRHVLCEKPMALSLEDADAMLAAADRAGCTLMIAQCVRFWPEYTFLRQAVEQNTYGRLLSLHLSRVGGRPIWSWEQWFLDPTRSGGALYDLHIHDVDYVHSLLGLPDRVQATARVTGATGALDLVHALYDYDDGPQVHLVGGWSVAQIPFQAQYEAWFERGVVRYDGRGKPTLTVYDDLQQSRGSPAEFEPGDAYYNEIAYFVDCVEKGCAPDRCPACSARDSLALVEREIEAAGR
jgi:predicted dehydrogenase